MNYVVTVPVLLSRVEPIYDIELITTTPQICGEGTQIDIAVESIPSVNFNWAPAEYVNEMNEDGSVITANPPLGEDNFDYIVTPITSLGCSTADTISILISDSLNITVDAPEVICTDLNNPELFTITAFGADSYTWSPFGPVIPTNPGSSEALIVPNPANNDVVFTVYGENESGECVGEHTFQIEVIQEPIVTIDVPTYCEDDVIQISTIIEGGSGNFDYQWFPTVGLDNPQIANPEIRIEEPINYTFVITDLDSGCEMIREIPIEINDLPEYTLSSLQSICIGESVILSIEEAISSDNIFWEDNQGNTYTGNNIQVNPTETTIYQATLGSPCPVQLNTTVEVANPQITINASETFICAGENVELTATGAANIEWINLGNTDNTSNPFQIVTPEETTTYFVAGYSADGGCRDSTAVTIEVGAVYLFSPLSQQICGDGAVDFVHLEVDGGEMASYNWNPPIGLSATDAPLVVANPDETTLYHVEVITADGCEENFNFLVEVFEAPSISISPSNVELCKNETQLFSLSGGVEYAISAESNQDFQIEYLSSNVVSITAKTDLDLVIEGMDTKGCLGTTEARVQIIDPILSHSDDTQICIGESIELSAYGGIGATYNWSPAELVNDPTVANPSISPMESTLFSVEVTNAVGCTDTEFIFVAVSPPIEAELEVVEGESFCEGEFRTLRIVSEQPDLYTFGWYNAQGNQIGGSDESSVVVSTTETSTFTVIISDANNCQKIEEITLQLEEINLTAQNATTCIGAGALINVSGAGIGGIYEWQPAEKVNCLNPECSAVETIPFETEEAVEFTITGTNENGCMGTTTATATAAQDLVLELSVPNPTLCAGESLELTIGGASEFTWEGAGLSATTGSSVTIDLEVAGTYEYTVVGMAGDCEKTLNFSVDVYEMPQIWVQDLAVCAGDAIALTADSNIELEYEWFDESGNEITNPVITPSETADYMVVGTSADNCQNTATFTIDVFPLPNISLNTNYLACAEESLNVEAMTDLENGFLQWLPSTGVENENSSNTVITASESTAYTLSATNEFGCVSLAATLIEITEDCVFPGDANNDGQVDMFDLFPLGANFNESGFARNNISNEWRGFGVEDWATEQASGLNLKYVDCNGNGTIGFEDTTAIVQNFDLLQKNKGFPKGSLGDPELRFSPLLTQVGVGESIEIEVWIGSLENPVIDLYAIAFETTFDPNLIDPSSIVIDYADSDLGAKNVDLLAVDLVNEQTGRLNVSMSRIAPPGKSGELYLLRIRMRTVAELEETTNLTFTISDFGATNSSEEDILVNLIELPTIVIDPGIVAIEGWATDAKPYQLYPNFIHDRFQLNSKLQKNTSLKVSLFALSGQQVGVLLEEEDAPMGKQEREMDLTAWSLAEGVYIVELQLEGKVFREKIVVW